MSREVDITGKVFGRLTAVRRAPVDGNRWEFLCSCGNTTVVVKGSVTSGNTNSCGCLHSEDVRTRFSVHGEAQKTKEHITWQSMKSRCLQPKNKGYARYGGRGITICQEWIDSYERFLLDMGRAPTPKHSLDRIDTNGNYEPDNCRWATPKEQANNKTTNRLLEFGGSTKSVAQWAEDSGISVSMLRDRLFNLKWSMEKAITTPALRTSHHE